MIKVFKYASGIVAAVPDLAGLLAGFTLPDREKWLFAGLTTLVPPLIVLGLMVYWTAIRKLPKPKPILWTGFCLVVFLIGLFVFIGLHGYCVIVPTNPAFDPTPVLFPFWLDGEVADKVAEAGGRVAFVNRYGPATASERIASMPGIALARPTTIAGLLLLFVTFATAAATAFALFGFYLTPPKDGPRK